MNLLLFWCSLSGGRGCVLVFVVLQECLWYGTNVCGGGYLF